MTITGNTMRRILAAAVIAVVGLTAWSTTAMADGNPNPSVLPVNAKAFGKTYAEWSAAWWQWALAIDGHANPIEDPDGQFASTGQGGKVWFLAGSSITAGGEPVERHVKIPPGKAIFFPILNSAWLTIPYPYPGAPDGDPPFSQPGAEQAARDAIAMDPTHDTLEVAIDGKLLPDLTRYRVQSTVFTTILPDYNWYDAVYDFLDIDIHYTGGIYPDSVADGYWIMLAPLSKGTHTIHLRGETNFGFVTDVLWHVTIK